MFSKELKSIFRDPQRAVVLFLIFVQSNKQYILRITEQENLTETLLALGAQNFERKRQRYMQRVNELEKCPPTVQPPSKDQFVPLRISAYHLSRQVGFSAEKIIFSKRTSLT